MDVDCEKGLQAAYRLAAVLIRFSQVGCGPALSAACEASGGLEPGWWSDFDFRRRLF